MQCPSVTGYLRESTGEYAYTLTYPPESIGSSIRHRARLLIDYRNASRYDCTETRTGLYVQDSADIASVEYIDWNTAGRPPMVEPPNQYTNMQDESFNSEIVAELSGAGGIVDGDGNVSYTLCLGAYLSGVQFPITVSDGTMADPVLAGESVILDMNSAQRLNVLTEFLDTSDPASSARIVSLRYSEGIVTAVTEAAHGFSDGDAITVRGVESCPHSLGVDGEQYNGIYRVFDCAGNVFRYRVFPTDGHMNPRQYDSDFPVAERWTACTLSFTGCSVISRSGTRTLVRMQPEDLEPGSLLVVGDRAVLGGKVLVAKYVDGAEVEFEHDPDVSFPAEFALEMSPRVPSADVPVNYVSWQLENSPAYSHASSASIIDVYDDTVVGGSESSGIIGIGSPSLEIGLGKTLIFKINPGHRGSMANTFSITLHISDNTYPHATLALYEMKNADWTAAITADEVGGLIAYDILDTATIDNPAISGGTAVTFTVTGSTVSRWFATGEPVALAIRVLKTNDIDSMTVCSTESVFPVTAVGGAGKGAVLDPEMFNVSVKPAVPSAGMEMNIFARGSGRFSGISGGDMVMFGDMRCHIVSASPDVLTVTVPEVGSPTVAAPLTVYRVSGTGEPVQCSNPVMLTVRGDVVKDVKLGDKLRAGVPGRRVNYRPAYSYDLSFNGFTKVTDANNMIQNVYNCLLTSPGERLFNRSFGAGIEDMLFSLYGADDYSGVIAECAKIVKTYEPRVTIDVKRSRVEEMSGGNGLLLILVIVIAGADAVQIRLPFKNRGVML